MAEQKKLTTIQRINRLFGTDTKIPVDYTRRQVNKYTINNPDIIFATHNKDEYDNKALELKQNKYLKWRWRKANYELDNQQYLNVSNVVLMYRDADLMDGFPEIGAALDIYSEETTYVGNSGKMVNVESKSERIKKILTDLLYNRLQINMTLPMISRSMCKYGNTYMLFDIDINNGIKGWRQLPVYEMERYEGMTDDNPYKGYYMNPSNNELEKDTSTKFVWVGENEFTPYWNWQIAHFRLLYDSLLLPYGMSLLQKSRRHWRMLSQMEDGMLLYRLERSWERRVFKINVGSINEDDVPAYIDSVANEFKRTPVVDPLTGQLDLRKNVLPVHKDTPIPLLDGRIITIEELAKEYENGKENYVYSVQDGSHSIVPGKVAWCGKNYTAKELIKVTLDDGGYIILAPEHEFIMRDGTKKRADKVCVGESVMPFYTKYKYISKKRKNSTYEQIYNPNTGLYEYTHRIVACENNKPQLKNGDKWYVIHHVDYDRYNNTPSNLRWMGKNEHFLFHSKLAKEHNYHLWHDDETRDMMRTNLYNYNHSELHKQQNQIRREVMKDFWKDEKKVAAAKKRMTVYFDKNVWHSINKSIMDGISYNRETLLNFINTNLIGYLTTINTNQRLKNNGYITRGVLEERLKAHGFNTITEYIEYIYDTYGGVADPREVIRKKKSEITTTLNRNKLKPFVCFDDNIYNAIKLNIINKKLNSVSEITKFLNENYLEYIKKINDIENEDFAVNIDTVTRRLTSLGFKNTTECIEAMRKNHKISKIELVGGDDVYCMTVTGSHGEDDRHNFAVLGRGIEQKVHEKLSGCFVSNCYSDDYVIPTRSDDAPNPIDTLPAAQNLTAIDDIKYILNKVLTGLAVPKPFINMEETTGDGKNLSLLDVRFARRVNKIQQCLLIELNKACIVHLAFLGFTDDLTNFTLSMNNPSSQAEMLELENLAKKITTVKDAVMDNGNGIPIMSMTRAWKEILGWSEKEIADNLEELRLEAALGAELKMTNQIIKRTGIFDKVDNIYGEAGAQYGSSPDGGQDDGGGMPGGGGGGAAAFGGDMDMGMPEGEDVEGAEGDMDLGDMAAEEGGEAGGAQEQAPSGGNENGGEQQQLAEAFVRSMNRKLSERKKTILDEKAQKTKHYRELLEKRYQEWEKGMSEQVPLYDKTFLVNEEINSMSKSMDNWLKSVKAKKQTED